MAAEWRCCCRLQLKNGEYHKYYNTLHLFAYGTYKDYRQQMANYILLSSIMLKKLQHLTLVSLATKNKCISYELLSKELEIVNVRHLEDVMIEAIYAGNWRVPSNRWITKQKQHYFMMIVTLPIAELYAVYS